MQSVTLDEGVTTYTLPASTFTPPTNETFSHWEVNGNYAGMAGEIIPVRHDITLTAEYGTPVDVTFTGGTAGGNDVVIPAITGQQYELPTPESLGFVGSFDSIGWVSPADPGDVIIPIRSGTIVTVTGAMTVMAVYLNDAFDVQFDPVNGTGDPVETLIYKGSESTVQNMLPPGALLGWEAPASISNPKLEWYSDAAATQKVGDPGDTVTIEYDTTFYGKWSEA